MKRSGLQVDECYGGFWRRMIAYVVDKLFIALLSIFILLITALLLKVLLPSRYEDIFNVSFPELFIKLAVGYYLLGLFVHMLYFTYFHGTIGQTPGKKVFGLRVINSYGEEMSIPVAFLRWVGYIVSSVFVYIGFFWIAIDNRKQGWHDKIAGTLVILTDKQPKEEPYLGEEKYLDKWFDIL